MTALSTRLADAKGQRSIDSIRDQAERAGHTIDRATIAKYVKGQHGSRPPEQTLAALAAGLDLDVRELRSLAQKPRGELEPWIPVPESARLDNSQRQALDELIRAIVKGAGHDGTQPAQKSLSSSEAGEPDAVSDQSAHTFDSESVESTKVGLGRTTGRGRARRRGSVDEDDRPNDDGVQPLPGSPEQVSGVEADDR